MALYRFLTFLFSFSLLLGLSGLFQVLLALPIYAFWLVHACGHAFPASAPLIMDYLGHVCLDAVFSASLSPNSSLLRPLPAPPPSLPALPSLKLPSAPSVLVSLQQRVDSP